MERNNYNYNYRHCYSNKYNNIHIFLYRESLLLYVQSVVCLVQSLIIGVLVKVDLDS